MTRRDAAREDSPGTAREANGEWHRVHPFTPFVRSWLLLVALVWGIANTFLDDFLTALLRHEPVDVDLGGSIQLIGAGLVVAVLCGVLGVLVGLGLLSWWFIRYQITDEHVRFRSGWLFRTQRQARLDRVQGIDIERRFLPRVLGLASLKFDVADGGTSVLELSYLGRAHALELRRQLLAAAHRASLQQPGATPPGPGPVRGAEAAASQPAAAARSTRPAPWATAFSRAASSHAAPAGDGTDPLDAAGAVVPGRSLPGKREGADIRVARRHGLLTERDEARPVLTIPTLRVLLGLVCSPPTVVLALLALATAGLSVWVPEALVVSLPSALPLLLAVVSGLYSRLERSWGFTLSEVPAGVRTRAGLFNERSSTIPAGRVQALEVTAPLLWRPFGGHRVTVVTAGKSGAGDGEGLGSVVLPVGTWADVAQVLALVLPLEAAPVELVREGLTGFGDAGSFTTSPRRARWLDPLTWRRTGFAMDHAVLVLRGGRLGRHASVLPHHKTQSTALAQGPVERRLGLCGFTAHVTPGSVTTTVEHLDVERARELQRRHTDAARLARERVSAGGAGMPGSVGSAATDPGFPGRAPWAPRPTPGA
ncbi:PH domain-containing protein [Kocuria sp.]|uniref:PH domain-containing protein n=1 Tax=Kocuria sp. TaxID=1871328 RepID=UPI0026DC855B|nr:PH domain-containing protein [Kocuria sp.]MDO4919210.1 PH domain-containing protein [Kocuria sp.]